LVLEKQGSFYSISQYTYYLLAAFRTQTTASLTIKNRNHALEKPKVAEASASDYPYRVEAASLSSQNQKGYPQIAQIGKILIWIIWQSADDFLVQCTGTLIRY